MEKKVLAAASFEKQKYFFEEEFSALPRGVQKELRSLLVLTAQKIHSALAVGFDGNGEIYIETVREGDPFDFDEIGAELEIKRLARENREFFSALELWHKTIYKGAKIK